MVAPLYMIEQYIAIRVRLWRLVDVFVFHYIGFLLHKVHSVLQIDIAFNCAAKIINRGEMYLS